MDATRCRQKESFWLHGPENRILVLDRDSSTAQEWTHHGNTRGTWNGVVRSLTRQHDRDRGWVGAAVYCFSTADWCNRTNEHEGGKNGATITRAFWILRRKMPLKIEGDLAVFCFYFRFCFAQFPPGCPCWYVGKSSLDSTHAFPILGRVRDGGFLLAAWTRRSLLIHGDS